MGACCSKTNNTITSTPTPPEIKIKHNPQQQENNNNNNNNTSIAIVASATEQQALKKDVFEVNPRKSNENDRHPDQETRKSIDQKKIPNSNPKTEIPQSATSISAGAGGVTTVRASSCTEEEVDAILIQCGRLSRSSSGVKPAGGETPTRGRRYSGSKRSFDFDLEMGSKNDDDEVVVVVDGDERQHHRRQQREVRVSSPCSRRRSRERDPLQQRSGSKERGSGNGGRRVSRSPNRRSESPNCNATVAASGGGGNRPGKMVSVPATDKSNNGGGVEVVAGGVKRVQVKRNAGEAVVAVGSRKAEQSPHRRNPLGEIDTNVVGSEQPGNKKPNGEKMMNRKGNNVKNIVAKDTQMLDETKTSAEDPKHNQIVSRTRTSRLSRDLDINPETLVNPNPPSYASLLLEDIQSFHHKNPTLSGSVSKGCSVLEAAADMKSATSFSDRQSKKEDLVETEKVVHDDLMGLSLHKYVTVRRGGDADTEEQESSGSNSFAGSQQLSWMSSSWEPNSGDSTDCWTSKSRSDAGDTEVEKSSEYPRNGIGRGRVGVHRRNAYSLPNNATVAST